MKNLLAFKNSLFRRYSDGALRRAEKVRHSQSDATAFTLIELLVVIAIIGILASLLLSAIAGAKRKALQAGCVSNQKQIGSAMVMFMDEHSQTIPGPCFMGVSRQYYQTTRNF